MTKFLLEFMKKRGKRNPHPVKPKKKHPWKTGLPSIPRLSKTVVTNPFVDLDLPNRKIAPIKKPTDFKLDTPRRGRKGFRV